MQAFHEVIKELTGYNVIRVAEATVTTDRLLDILDQVSRKAGSDMIEDPMVSSSPNKVGNYIERRIQNALRNEDSVSVVPMSYSTGYPDIKANLTDTRETMFIECKTFGIGKGSLSNEIFLPIFWSCNKIKGRLRCPTCRHLL